MTRWTIEETFTLESDYRTYGARIVALKTGRTEIAVRVKAHRIGKYSGVKRETPRGKRILVPGKLRDTAQSTEQGFPANG